MKTKITILTLFTLLFCCHSLYPADTKWTWTGGAGTTEWSTKSNWSTTDNDNLAGTGDTVVIDSNTNVFPQLTANVTVNTFIMTGGWVFINGYNLTVINNIYMTAGKFSAYLSGVIAANMYLYGGGIGVSSGLDVSGEIVIDGGYFILFSGGVTVGNDMSLISGTLDLATFDLTINDKFTYKSGDLVNLGQFSISNFIMDSPGTLNLPGPVNVTTSARFIKGIVKTTSSALLILDDNATASGASDIAHVNGPVRKLMASGGNSAFEFPVGNGSVFAPISISDFALERSQDYFTAQYIKASPPYNNSSLEGTLDHISNAEYWMLDRGASTGTATTIAKVTLSFNETKRSGALDPAAQLRVVKWDGTAWQDLGLSGFTGSDIQGTLKSDLLVSSFSPFTIGSVGGNTMAPAAKIKLKAAAQDKKIKVSWSTASDNIDFFIVQKSTSGNKNWVDIGTVNGVVDSGQMKDYSFTDLSPVNGVQHYRLMLTDMNGDTTYTKMATINYKAPKSTSLSLSPNPASGKVTLSISDPVKNATITVYNSMGNKVMELTKQNGKSFSLDISNLEKGTYTIEISHSEGIFYSKVLKN